MAWHDKFLTARVFCCSAIVASQVTAILSLIECSFLGIWFWFPVTKWLIIVPMYFKILQTVGAILSIIACGLVFVGSFMKKPVLIIPAVIIQALITVNIIVTIAIWLTWVFPLYDVGGMIFWMVFYMVMTAIALFAFVYHAGCYKWLRIEVVRAHHSARHHDL